MIPWSRLLVAQRAMVAMAALAFAVGPNAAQQDVGPLRFRTGADLVVVDVQAVGPGGLPVMDLGRDNFAVSFDGRRREVISADLVRYETGTPVAAGVGEPTSHDARVPPFVAPARTFVVVIDALTFDVGASRSVAAAAREFIAQLPADDVVGLFVYPLGPKLDPTRDHQRIIEALDDIVGQQTPPPANQFALSPADIVDWWSADRGHISQRVCPPGPSGRGFGFSQDPSCMMRLGAEVMGATQHYEGLAQGSLGMLRSLLGVLATLPGRKTLVLVSGGMPVSDRPGGRPDIGNLAADLGEAAARAHANVYTLFVDHQFLERFRAEQRTAPDVRGSSERDSQIKGRWLDQFTGTAGGRFMRVLVGHGESSFDRILLETSAFYLLAVTPAADDFGRTRQVRVTVDRRGVTVLARRWVAIDTRPDR